MKVAIAGYGVEGEINYAYWAADPANDITIVDENTVPSRTLPSGVPTLLGPQAPQQLEGFELVVRTAGLAPYKINTNGKIWSGTNEFFAHCPAHIIGVTGTKGKGTTASLIAAIFEAAAKKVWLVGNIGLPALSVLKNIQPDDIVVYELSSFQLWDLEKSPQTSVVLLIEPDHLNVHTEMEDYVRAKGAIRRYQKPGEICVYHPTNQYAHDIAVNNTNAGRAIRYGVETDGGVYVADGFFWQATQKLCPLEALQLIGIHNQENACAAMTVALEHGITAEAIERGLRTFKGLPHRTELVRTLDGVDYYNDSFSSAPAATVAAIRSFKQPEIVIVGGTDKGGDFSLLYSAINAQQNIKEVIVIGEIRNKLYKEMMEAGITAQITVFDGQTMAEIVNYARSRAEAGDVVVLSPACASFDMFKDFNDRGTQFREYVQSL